MAGPSLALPRKWKREATDEILPGARRLAPSSGTLPPGKDISWISLHCFASPAASRVR